VFVLSGRCNLKGNELLTDPSCNKNTSSYIDDIQSMLQHVDVKVVRGEDVRNLRMRKCGRKVRKETCKVTPVSREREY
jgi:hypothetical protein